MSPSQAPLVQGVHFVGSIPYSDPAATFAACGPLMGKRLHRISDGEPDERQQWIVFQRDLFKKHPASLLPIDYTWDSGAQVSVEDVKNAVADLAPLETGYDTAAIASYEHFKAAKQKGLLPSNTRLMVAFPTVLAFVGTQISQAWRVAVEPIYEDGLIRAIKKLQATIPHEDLAIQIDFVIELNVLDAQQIKPWYDDVYEGTLERVTRLASHVEDDVELGFHCCCGLLPDPSCEDLGLTRTDGDLGHKHWKEPEDLYWVNRCMMEMKKRLPRNVSFIQMPVPRSRNDAEYFRPIKELVDNQGETEIYLGLIHPDGIEANQKRIDAAAHTVPVFGVATECGLGRTPAEEIETIMKTSAAVAAPFA